MSTIVNGNADSRIERKSGMTVADTYVLEEVSEEAWERFAHRADARLLVEASLNAAREILAGKPKITAYVADMALARATGSAWSGATA